MSFNKSKEFKALEALWYQKLEQNGFKDIELTHTKDRLLKIYDSKYFKLWYSAESYEDKEIYYRRARAFYWEHTFPNPEAKEIWRLHAEGIGYREIAKALRTDSNRLNKDKVQAILEEIKKEFRFFAVLKDPSSGGDGDIDEGAEEEGSPDDSIDRDSALFALD